jgi:phosphatidylserine decarboxylase
VWRLFTDLDLSEAQQQRFDSLHDCFTRELKPGARPVDPDPDVLASPCDAIVGACGTVHGHAVLQAKGMPYRAGRAVRGRQDAAGLPRRQLRHAAPDLGMYHRFHAPHDGVLEHVRYISGDTWNVNPIALKRVERLFCRNERAVLRSCAAAPAGTAGAGAGGGHPGGQHAAALRWTCCCTCATAGPNEMPCDAPVRKGQELGWFEHGSTIIVFAPPGFALAPGIAPGARVRMGQALMQLPVPRQASTGPGVTAAAGRAQHGRPAPIDLDLVYFNAGGGHRAAAQALEPGAAARSSRPWQVRLVNLTEVLDPRRLFRRLTGLASPRTSTTSAWPAASRWAWRRS